MDLQETVQTDLVCLLKALLHQCRGDTKFLQSIFATRCVVGFKRKTVSSIAKVERTLQAHCSHLSLQHLVKQWKETYHSGEGPKGKEHTAMKGRIDKSRKSEKVCVKKWCLNWESEVTEGEGEFSRQRQLKLDCEQQQREGGKHCFWVICRAQSRGRAKAKRNMALVFM